MNQYKRMTKVQLIHELETQRDSMEWLEAIAEGSRDAIFISDEGSRFIRVNSAACELTGYSEEELLEMRIPDLYESVDQDAYRIHHASIMAGQDALTEAEVFRKDGTKVTAQFNNRRITVAGTFFMHTVGRDITEWKRAKEELREREVHWRTLTRVLPDPVWLKDVDGTYLACNPRFERFFGAKEAEVVGKTDYDFVDEELADFFREKDKAAIAAGESCVNEEELTFADDGHVEIVETVKTPMFDSGGELVGVLGIAHDITERKRVETKLLESEKRLRDLVETTSDWIWEFDVRGRYTYCSDTITEVLGYTAEEILGKSPFDLMPEEEAARVGEIFAGIVDKKRPFVDLENWNLSKDGRDVCLLTNGVPIFDEDGELIGYRGADKDITERKRAEETLRESEARYERTANTVPLMLYEYVLRPDGTNSFLYVAPQPCRELLELDPEALLADANLIWNMVHPEDIGRLHQEDMAANREGIVFTSEVRITTPSGRLKWVRVKSKPNPGELTVWSGFIEDITDPKRVEEELRESRDRLRELAARLDEVRDEERTMLARELHDEVGQNLTAMRMDLSSLERGFPEGKNTLADRIHSMIDLAQDSVDRVNRMSFELRPPVLDVLGIEAAVENEVEEYRERWGNEIDLKLELGKLEALSERDTAVYRILKESLSNVMEHAKASRIGVSLRVVGDELVLEVLDDGIGITKDQIGGPRSFGLMGMRERVERLGGNFEVERRPEGGTRVRAVIPVASEEGTASR